MNDFLYYICVPCTYLFKDVVTQYDFLLIFPFDMILDKLSQKLKQNVVSKISWCLISIRKCERKLYQNQMVSGSIWPFDLPVLQMQNHLEIWQKIVLYCILISFAKIWLIIFSIICSCLLIISYCSNDNFRHFGKKSEIITSHFNIEVQNQKLNWNIHMLCYLFVTKKSK